MLENLLKKPRKRKEKVVEVEPDYPDDFFGLAPPQSLVRNTVYGEKTYTDRFGNKTIGKLHLHSYGANKKAPVLFVSPCALLEELDGRNSKPSLMKGPAANLFRRQLMKAGFADEDWRYTAVARYNVVKLKPTKQDIRWSAPLFFNEIEAQKPKIIVCLGKVPLTLLVDMNLTVAEIQGGFLTCDRYPDILVYAMDTIITPLMKPELLERCLVDLKTVKRELDTIRGVTVAKVETSYHVLETADSVSQWVDDMVAKGENIQAVDMEWGGRTYVDGQPRSIQHCWKPGHACFIKLMDENKQRTMDVDDKTVGQILNRLYARPEFKFLGHNFPADAVWLEHRFGVNTYQKCAFDTMFAQQVLDEYADLKLERMALRYTDLGRYDLDLYMWKKKAKDLYDEHGGYDRVPDAILQPYGMKDVDACKRMHPHLLQQLCTTGLAEYYFKISLPFTSDVYIHKMLTGMPVDLPYMDHMRETFHANLGTLLEEFRESIKVEARQILMNALLNIDGQKGLLLYQQLMDPACGDQQAMELTKEFAGPERWQHLLPIVQHWQASDTFNYNSTDDLKRWLFGVKGLKPIKTTKKDNIQMAWEKVLLLPKDRQAEFQPAVDKQTLKIYSEGDAMVARILELKSVNTMCKTFLRTPDPETGEERGIIGWVCSDKSLRANWSATETGRPRSWNPNILNWPKSVSKPIEAAFLRLNKRSALSTFRDMRQAGADAQQIRQACKAHLAKPTTLRSGIKAYDGWCFTDADLVTAEVVALGYLSGDINLINACESPDEQYGLTPVVSKDGKPELDENGKQKLKAVRYQYIPTISAVPAENQDEALLWKELDRLLRDEKGEIRHPKRDVHWQMAESFMRLPRERLSKDLHRGGGKVGMFCIAEGEMVATDRGWVPIERVKLTDKVWDGEEFVSHEGVVCNGVKAVVRYDGLCATPNHMVWSFAGNKMTFGEIIDNDLLLSLPVTPKNCGIADLPKTAQRIASVTERRVCRVYDILNAGPRHRYVCSGVLVSNSIPYGATPTLIDRNIEVLTGKKPEPGTGEKIVAAYESNFPVATQYLRERERNVVDPGFFRSVSGRVRHFHVNMLEDVEGLSEWQRKGILSPLTREARNYPLQEIVAATMARASIMLINKFREEGMKARLMILLYDAMTVLSPLEERHRVRELLQWSMSDNNIWNIPADNSGNARTLQFDIDLENTIRWATKLSKAEKAKLFA